MGRGIDMKYWGGRALIIRYCKMKGTSTYARDILAHEISPPSLPLSFSWRDFKPQVRGPRHRRKIDLFNPLRWHRALIKLFPCSSYKSTQTILMALNTVYSTDFLQDNWPAEICAACELPIEKVVVVSGTGNVAVVAWKHWIVAQQQALKSGLKFV